MSKVALRPSQPADRTPLERGAAPTQTSTASPAAQYVGSVEGKAVKPAHANHSGQVKGLKKYLTIALFACMAGAALPGMASAQEVAPQQAPPQTQTDTKTTTTPPDTTKTTPPASGLASPAGVVTVPIQKAAPAAPADSTKAATPAGGLAQPAGVVTVPTGAAAPDAGDADPHAHDFGRFHIGGDVDDFDATHSKGIDAGDWQSPLDNFQGGFVRGEFVRNFRVDGLTLTHGDTDKGTFAGVELGGIRARTDNDINLSGGFIPNGLGNLNGDKGVNLQIEGDETIGVNLARFNVHNTQDLGNGNSNEVGVRGYLNATAEYDAMYNLSSGTPSTPNGFTGTTRLGIGGQVEGYDQFTHTTDKGVTTLSVHAGEAYNLAGQGVYGNRSNDRADPFAYATQSYQFKGGKLDGVTIGAREDVQPTSNGTFTRVAGSVEKDVKVFGQDATLGVYAGHEQLGSQGSNFVGAGITFHF